jgi:hypothetical protein
MRQLLASRLRPHLGLIARFVVGAALVAISAPRLVAVFNESETKNLLKSKQFIVSAECRKPASAFAYVDVRNDGSANYTLTLTFSEPQVGANDCARLDIAVPGMVVDVKGGREGTKDLAYLYAKPSFGLSVSDPTVKLVDRGPTPARDYDAASLTLTFDERRFRSIVISGRDEAFLIDRTYSSKMLNMSLACTGNLLADTPARESCTSDGVAILEDAYQIGTDFTGLAISMESTGKSRLELPKAAASRKMATVSLENLRKSRTRDLQIVFTGTLLATGIAILAEFIIEFFAAIGEASKPLARPPVQLTKRERAIRRMAWRTGRQRGRWRR